MKHVLPLVITALVAGTTTHAQDTTAEIDTLFSWVTPSSPGCSVAVSREGQQLLTRAYGLADLERNVPITPDTVFDAASVVKQFVAAATLLLVEDGKLSLTEDVHKYIPELPDYGRPITLDHLMTHTSGLRDWTGLGPLTGRNIDALTVTLRQRSLDFAPGEEWSYSNSGYVLLKEVIARTSGMSFGEFTRARLFEPLEMKKTAYLGDLRTIVRNRALAYERRGGDWRLDMQLDNDRGGGGALLSTPSDLLRWNAALTSGRLGAMVTAKLQEPARLNNGRVLTYARGLFLENTPGRRVQWHSGGSAGYGTFLARFPDHGFSVATMCNAGDAATGGAYARRIFALMVPAAATAGAEATEQTRSGDGASLDGLDVSGRAGVFFSDATSQPLRLVVDKGRLRVVDGPVLEVLAADRFRMPRGILPMMSQDQFALHFVSPDLIELTSMEGKTTRYRRAQPDAPGPADLKVLAGRYRNEENKAVMDVAPGKAGLVIRLNDSAPYEFRPVDRDAFQMRGMIVRFRRGEGGTVTAVDYSNPVVRNVEFTPISEPSARR